jgi:hypothetical protein
MNTIYKNLRALLASRDDLLAVLEALINHFDTLIEKLKQENEK